MPESLSQPPVDAADEEIDPVAHAFANTNPLSYPFVRAFFNYIASKLSTLSKSKISRLTDDELARLIKDECSRLTEAEKIRLMDAEFDRLKAIADSIFRFFTGNSLESFFTSKEEEEEEEEEEEITPITPPLNSRATSKKEEITLPLDSGLTHDDFINRLGIISTCIAVLLWLMMLVGEHYKGRSYSYTVSTNAAQERLRPLQRSIFLSKYSRTPDLEGLKSIGELYTGS